MCHISPRSKLTAQTIINILIMLFWWTYHLATLTYQNQQQIKLKPLSVYFTVNESSDM